MSETPQPKIDLPEGIPPEIAAKLDSVDRRLVLYCVLVMGVLGAASAIGMGSSLYLVNHHPLLLVALSPIARHMVLVASVVDPVAFVVVIVIRRTVFYFASFQMGCALGPVAIDWLKYRYLTGCYLAFRSRARCIICPQCIKMHFWYFSFCIMLVG